MAGNQGTLEITDGYRKHIQTLRGAGVVHILCGMLGSLAHQPVQGSQLVAFIKAMQGEMPEVFHVFGDDPEDHVRALVPEVLTRLEGGRYSVNKEGHGKFRDRLSAVSGRDLSEKNPANWILAAVFVRFRGSMRPSAPDPMLEAAHIGK